MKKKIIIAASLVLAIAVAVFGLLTFLDHQKQEKAKQEREKYERSRYYTGKWEIDKFQKPAYNIFIKTASKGS